MIRGPVIQRLIDHELDAALARNSVAYDHPMRQELNEGAELLEVNDVRVPDARGNLRTLDERISELKHDERWVRGFPPDPPAPKRISRKNQQALSENFSEIAKGTVIVE